MKEWGDEQIKMKFNNCTTGRCDPSDINGLKNGKIPFYFHLISRENFLPLFACRV